MEIQLARPGGQGLIFRRNLQILAGSNLTLTPLVDVIFLLLIFFMIGSSLVFQPGITVNLPETRQEFKSVADKLIITLTQNLKLPFKSISIHINKSKFVFTFLSIYRHSVFALSLS